MKNISKFIEKHQKLMIFLFAIIAIIYFGYAIYTIIINHVSVGDTNTAIPSFDTISSYFTL
jgi:hypothetical protein